MHNGKLYVADCEDHRVAVYSALTLKYERSFGHYGEDEGGLTTEMLRLFWGRMLAPEDEQARG